MLHCAVWPSGMTLSRKGVTFKRQCADTLAAPCSRTINFRKAQAPGDPVTLTEPFFSPVPLHLFVSLAGVISNQNKSNSLPEIKSSPGQTDVQSAGSPAVRLKAIFVG